MMAINAALILYSIFLRFTLHRVFSAFFLLCLFDSFVVFVCQNTKYISFVDIHKILIVYNLEIFYSTTYFLLPIQNHTLFFDWCTLNDIKYNFYSPFYGTEKNAKNKNWTFEQKHICVGIVRPIVGFGTIFFSLHFFAFCGKKICIFIVTKHTNFYTFPRAYYCVSFHIDGSNKMKWREWERNTSNLLRPWNMLGRHQYHGRY